MTAWDGASYEVFARQIEPVAGVVVGRAAPQPGERALDVGCGSGNATVLLAQAGAAVTAVDPGERLLAVARERVGGDLETTVAVAEDLPFPDGAFDVVVSVFAVIFSERPEAAAAELARVTAPGGRIVLSAWYPGTAFERAMAPVREAMAELGRTRPTEWPWHDGLEIAQHLTADTVILSTDGTVPFVAGSGAAFVADMEAHHPMWQGVVSRLREAGRWDAVRADVIAGLEAESVADDRLELPVAYVVHEIWP